MDFIIRYALLVLVTFAVSYWYEGRRKSQALMLSIYFAVVALVFLL